MTDYQSGMEIVFGFLESEDILITFPLKESCILTIRHKNTNKGWIFGQNEFRIAEIERATKIITNIIEMLNYVPGSSTKNSRKKQ